MIGGINLKIIPHGDQRYETVGDWWYARDNTWEIRISKMSDWRYELLIAIHEILEMAWCTWQGVSEESVTAFDIEFEHRRFRKEVGEDAEPGDDPKAPYYVGHQAATIVERVAALTLGVRWAEYELEVLNLYNGK